MMTASGAPGLSRQVKSRPCLIGMPRVRRNRDESSSGRRWCDRSPAATAGLRPRRATACCRCRPPEDSSRPRRMGHAGQRFDFLDRVLEKQTLALDIRIRAGRQTDEKCRNALRRGNRDRRFAAGGNCRSTKRRQRAGRARARLRRSANRRASDLPGGPLLPRDESFSESIGSLRDACSAGTSPRTNAGDRAKARQRTASTFRSREISQHARKEVLRDFLQQIESPDREQHAKDTGDRRGQNALGQELQDDAGAGRAERSADGDFFSARGETGQQKIRRHSRRRRAARSRLPRTA